THSNNGLTEALEETCGTIPGNTRAAATLNATALRCGTLTALAGRRPAVGAFRIGAVLRSRRFHGLRRRSRFFAVGRALTPVQPQLVSPFERGAPVTRPDVRIDWNPDHAVRLASIVFHRCSFRHKPLWCLHFRPHIRSIIRAAGTGSRGARVGHSEPARLRTCRTGAGRTSRSGRLPPPRSRYRRDAAPPPRPAAHRESAERRADAQRRASRRSIHSRAARSSFATRFALRGRLRQ